MIRRVACALAVVPLALMGCTSDDKPKPTVLPSASSGPASPAPSIAPVPTVPAEARLATAAGASAFARFYLDELNAAFETGEATRVRSLSDPGCASCARLIDAIERPRPAGERVEGGDYVVAGVASTLDAPGTASTLVDYGQSAVRVLDPSGAVIRERAASPPAPATIDLKAHSSMGWVVMAFTDVPQ